MHEQQNIQYSHRGMAQLAEKQLAEKQLSEMQLADQVDKFNFSLTDLKHSNNLTWLTWPNLTR